MSRRPIVAGNWKMNLTAAEALRLTSEVIRTTARHHQVDVAVIPTSAFVMPACGRAEGSRLIVAGQDIDAHDFGARTGAMNAVQLASTGAQLTLVGHSERRVVFGDSDADCAAKLRAARDAGLAAMLCVGESEHERDQGQTKQVLERQLAGGLAQAQEADWEHLSIAYEPVWAIGTGRTASAAQAQEAHSWVRAWVSANVSEAVAQRLRILYGGSVKPANASELLACEGIDGALVGGASLDAGAFAEIVAAAAQSRV